MGSINLLWVASGTVGLLIGWLLRGSYSGQALRGAQIRAAQAESLAVERLDRLSETEALLQHSGEP